MRNVAIAGVLMMDDEYARCLQEYEIHYGSQVQEGCVRDLMNAESIPQEVRDQWYAERFGSE